MSAVFMVGIIIVLVWAMLCYTDIRRAKKHDHVLFAFNRLRRKVMSELFAHYDMLSPDCRGTLSRTEVDAAQLLLEMLDKIARHYDQHKTTMFNLRTMRRMIEQDLTHYQEARQKVQARLSQVPPNTKIAALYDTFSQAMATAFLAYTPFIRTEIILRLLWADIAAQVAKIQQEQKMLDGRIA